MMPANEWTDNKIIQHVKGDEASADKALRAAFYELDWKGTAMAMVRSNGGDANDAFEIAVKALEQLYFNIRQDKFDGRAALRTYFLSIVRFQWLRYVERRKTFSEINTARDDQELGNEWEEFILDEEKITYLEKATGVLGKSCQEVFKMRAAGYPHEVIATRLNLKNANMAKRKLYRCRQKFHEFLKANPGWYDHLNQ